ncbi:hypothetical protein C8D89_11425 [Actinomycetospora cinnamomea]|uniref:Uncharacterized protein n=1 Tax=Actinomycetospora cinnamomea TaxID=663609 RepID=A0A2U1F0S9_9PSEU|nr:hypothetical protein C8D89_11425 [Actinomycetospora cinnamomea]
MIETPRALPNVPLADLVGTVERSERGLSVCDATFLRRARPRFPRTADAVASLAYHGVSDRRDVATTGRRRSGASGRWAR